MKLAEAYAILELDSGASDDDVKKQFRKLASKYHPDVNKDPGAEEKSKQISEAYQVLKDKKTAEPEDDFPFWSAQGHTYSNGNFHDVIQFFNLGGFPNFNNRRASASTNITITFEEAILGCTKKVSLERFLQCGKCFGKGFTHYSGDPCGACNGAGFQGNPVGNVRRQCGTCLGKGKIKIACTDCDKASGQQKVSTSFDVRFPPGLFSGAQIRLPGGGHQSNGRFDDAIVRVTVVPDHDMSMSGSDVISKVEISLLESLTGVTKKVKTVHGEKPLHINSRSRHQDKVILPGHGVGGVGHHVFILDVKLPERGMEDIINVLSDLEKKESDV